jgi:RNA polymerase sigma factor (sigma-70 family)
MGLRVFEAAPAGDAQLLAGCLAGDQQSWDELVRRYSRLVYSIALKSGLSVDDASDVVQNVFTIVLRRLESLQQGDRFSAWLITISRRESWRYKRSLRQVVLDDGMEVIDPEPDAEHQVVAWEHASLTLQALENLGGRCQQLLTLMFLRDDKPSYTDISDDLGIAVGSIGPIRARCLKRLREQLSALGVTDAGG